MKRILTLLLCAAVLCTLCACGKGNTLFQTASPDSSAIEFYTFDGESGLSRILYAAETEKQLLKRLAAVPAKAVEDWTPAQITMPIYALWVGTEDGFGIEAAWSNGFLILRDGSVYQFDFDFAGLESSYAWAEGRELSAAAELPCGRYLCEGGGIWYSENMLKAEEHEPTEGMSLRILGLADGKLETELTNDSAEDWFFGEYFGLQVKQFGDWYIVPATPEKNWAFTDLGLILQAGETQQKTYDLEMFGSLPEGEYRLTVENLSAEFIIK